MLLEERFLFFIFLNLKVTYSFVASFAQVYTFKSELSKPSVQITRVMLQVQGATIPKQVKEYTPRLNRVIPSLPGHLKVPVLYRVQIGRLHKMCTQVENL